MALYAPGALGAKAGLLPLLMRACFDARAGKSHGWFRDEVAAAIPLVRPSAAASAARGRSILAEFAAIKADVDVRLAAASVAAAAMHSSLVEEEDEEEDDYVDEYADDSADDWEFGEDPAE